MCIVQTEELIAHDAPDATIAKRVSAAVISLLQYDAYLFECNLNERSITHRLAVHLAPQFPNWHIDCEYNRDEFDAKTLHAFEQKGESNETNGSRVFPDIVIHHRGKCENLLVIEVKKSTSNRTDENDLAKLRALRQELKYSHALFLRFTTGSKHPAVETAEWC